MNKSDSIVALADALSKAQAELKSAPFNRTNKFLGNKYADLGSVIETAKPVLCKNGLSFSQIVINDGDRIGIETVLMHKSGEWISGSVTMQPEAEKGKSFAQVAGSIMSYLRRYSLASIIGLYADDDDDGNGTGTGNGQGTTGSGTSTTGTGTGNSATGNKAAPASALKDTDVATAGSVPMVKYGELATEATKKGISAPAVTPGKTTVGELRKMYAELHDKVYPPQAAA